MRMCAGQVSKSIVIERHGPCDRRKFQPRNERNKGELFVYPVRVSSSGLSKNIFTNNGIMLIIHYLNKYRKYTILSSSTVKMSEVISACIIGIVNQ